MIFNVKPARRLAGGLVALGLSAGLANAAVIEVSITNAQGAQGAFLTPLLSVFHDGTYDSFNVGEAASAGVEAIAEVGNVAVEQAGNAAGRTTAVVANPAGFAGAPVIDPGETATVQVDLDPAKDIFFSFLSMIIPSNDAFIGNDDATAYRLFDAAGNFTNLGAINIYASNIYNAGTEVDNGEGAAFSALGGVGTDENGVIGAIDLSYLAGTPTAAGTIFNDIPTGNDLVATITLTEINNDPAPVPLPAGLPLLAGALGLLGLRRKLV